MPKANNKTLTAGAIKSRGTPPEPAIKKTKHKNTTYITFDMNMLKRFMHLNPTAGDTAFAFDIDEKTLRRRIMKEFGLTFDQFKQKHLNHTRQRLITMALKRAKKSDIMLIFTLKNLCGWGDKMEFKNEKPDVEKLKDLPGFKFISLRAAVTGNAANFTKHKKKDENGAD